MADKKKKFDIKQKKDNKSRESERIKFPHDYQYFKLIIQIICMFHQLVEKYYLLVEKYFLLTGNCFISLKTLNPILTLQI